jgi:hypothetical protein
VIRTLPSAASRATKTATAPPGVRLFVGGHASQVQGEKQDLVGDRCFTAVHRAQRCGFDPDLVAGLLDSGAFTDPPEKRLSPEGALLRQLAFEEHASAMWGKPWRAHALVSYDLLIDETWVGRERHKRRWSVAEADRAVEETVVAARYLTECRELLAPRELVLSLQGVDPIQYAECADEVLKVATSDDWIGLGGWCILGRHKKLLPVFWATLRLILPRIERAGVKHVHIFGVLWREALGGLLWLADRHGLTVSTDSTAPVLACTRKDWKKAGVKRRYWRSNVLWWQEELAGLPESEFYREPPMVSACRQEALIFDEAGV